MKRRTFLKFGTGAAVSGALAACGGGGSTWSPPPPPPPLPKVVSGWARAALQAVRTIKPGPPMVARSLAVLHTCMYNAWATYDAVAQPMPPCPQLRRPAPEHTAANRAQAMSYAAHAALVDQFPAQKAAFDAYLQSLGYDLAAASGDITSPARIGATLAGSMIGFCHADGSNQLGDMAPGGVPYADYTGYQPLDPAAIVTVPTPLSQIPEPNHWQPLTYTDATGTVITPGYMGAAWGLVKPFALTSGGQYRPGPPARFGTPEYADQAKRIVDVQVALTEEQKVIAEYWADGPNSELPPGHWMLFGLYVSERDGHTDDDDVKLFFALSNAVSDAGIAAWDAKRAYDSERPITAIRCMMQGLTITGYGPEGPAGGLRPIQGEAWVPYQPTTFPTPPFPEHVSGHSTFSAAGAEVLRRFTGSDAFGASYVKPAHSLKVEPNLPTNDLTLSWATFTDAAQQAGLSRIYGGIHFDNANVAGLDLGRNVGAAVFAKAQSYWLGQA
jgi:hypothetical protein